MPRWPSFDERFESNTRKTETCWEWIGTRLPTGYGTISRGGRMHYAHRLSYEINIGPIPTGNVVRHTCDNPPCVRPDHLLVGTQAENMADMYSRCRHAKTHAVPPNLKIRRMSDLDRSMLLTLRSQGLSFSELGRRFGVSTMTAFRNYQTAITGASTILQRKAK